ncbi:MAG TPA: hypothetical protein VFI52_13345 [Gemmatimonadaceae bacterium]|nr:hypothetical protein [Gemmatimonadaceae bacterium]
MDVELAVVVMRITSAFVFAACCLAATGGVRAARAQNVASAEPSACVAATGPDSGVMAPESAMRPAPRAPRDTAQHTTVRLFAAVHADEVQFARQPKICVKMSGDVQLDSVRVVGRRNLASPVVSGTTYRDIYVAVEILGRLNAECISARITGAAPAGQAAGPCASIGVRDTTAGRRTGAPPP